MQTAALLKYLFERLKYCLLISYMTVDFAINSLNAELNPICHLVALLGAHHILHVSRIRVKCVTVFIVHEKYVAFHLM
jgi:hypothetical protein